MRQIEVHQYQCHLQQTEAQSRKGPDKEIEEDSWSRGIQNLYEAPQLFGHPQGRWKALRKEGWKICPLNVQNYSYKLQKDLHRALPCSLGTP